jgi:SAM domain (Sterile alpha motif)
MSDVPKWLEPIGLAHYGDIFESDDLDIDLLWHSRIDVSSAGRRLRIRNAIAYLRSDA